MIAQRPARALLRLALGALVLAVFTYTRADPDLWGHVRFGRDIVASRTVAASDPYSFTSDRAWVNHEWLAEAAMSLAYGSGAGAGLIALKVALLAAMMAAIVMTLRRAHVSGGASDLLVGLVLIGTVAQANHVRPQLFSLALFAWLLAVLISAAGGRRAALLWTIPLLMIWANLHGGWIVGAGVVAIWCAADLIGSTTPREKKTTAAIASVAIAATLVNPYGWRLWAFLIETVRLNRVEINDWQPVYRLGAVFVLLWMLVTVAMIAALAIAARRRSLDRRALAVAVVMAVAAFQVNRLLAFYAIAIVVLLGPHLAGLRRLESPADGQRAPSRTAVGAALAVALALIAGAAVASARNASCVHMDAWMFPEADVASVVQRAGLRGRMLIWFDWGEYAIWHFAPAIAVSIDGRRETVYSDAVVQQQLRFYFVPAERQAIVQRLRPDYVWVPSHLEVAHQLVGDGWTPVFSGPQSVLLARTAWTREATIAVPPAPRCFPGP